MDLLENLKKRVLSEIYKQQEQVALPISKLIQTLGKKKNDLSKKISHVEMMCGTADPLTKATCVVLMREIISNPNKQPQDTDLDLITGILQEALSGIKTSIHNILGAKPMLLRLDLHNNEPLPRSTMEPPSPYYWSIQTIG